MEYNFSPYLVNKKGEIEFGPALFVISYPTNIVIKFYLKTPLNLPLQRGDFKGTSRHA
jgi:hypothetical protein